MMRVLLEIVPHGFEDEAFNIGVLEIVNVTPMREDIGDYAVTLDGVKLGTVLDFPRTSGPWTLVEKAVGLITADLRLGL